MDDKINVKILGYYGKGNFGDDLLYLSLTNILKELNVTYSKSNREGFFKPSYVNKIFESDHQISIGGLLQSTTSFRSFMYYITMLNLARSNILFGHSFGPFGNSKRCFRIMKNIKGLTGVLTRDIESYRLANELWMDRDVNIEYGTDIVFNLDLSKYLSKADNEKYAIIVIKKGDRKRVTELIEFIKKYLNMQIVVTVFDKKDKEEFRRIKHDFYEDSMVKTIFPKTLKEALNLIYNAHYVFSWRLHPIILSIIFEKPFYNMANNRKIMNFLSPYIEPFIADYEIGFEYMFEKLDVRKLRKKHFELAEKNIDFIKRNLNKNILGKEIKDSNSL